MIDLNNYENVQPALPGEFSKLPPGGYVCRVIAADITNSKAGNPMLVLSCDIAEGDFAGFFKNAVDRVKHFNSNLTWDFSAIYRQLIFDKNGHTSSFFKGLITCFEKSNPNVRFNYHSFDEQLLRGLLIGFIFAEEEFLKRDGSVSSRSFIKFPKPVSDIRNNNFSVPAIKKISPASSSSSSNDIDGTPVNNFDVPF